MGKIGFPSRPAGGSRDLKTLHQAAVIELGALSRVVEVMLSLKIVLEVINFSYYVSEKYIYIYDSDRKLLLD